MKILVGLGNPGAEYELNRHNVGFLSLDLLIAYFGLEVSWQKKYNALFANASINGQSLILIKPQTFMNLSGNAITPVKQFFKVQNDDIFVIHDELDVKNSEIRFKTGGGSAGHNGLKSIDEQIGANYHRIRIGIGRPLYKSEVSDYVLFDFPKTELELIKEKLKILYKNVDLLFEKNFNELNKAFKCL
jgi:PTH1 family peptidyl-tRNA hydrolase